MPDAALIQRPACSGSCSKRSIPEIFPGTHWAIPTECRAAATTRPGKLAKQASAPRNLPGWSIARHELRRRTSCMLPRNPSSTATLLRTNDMFPVAFNCSKAKLSYAFCHMCRIFSHCVQRPDYAGPFPPLLSLTLQGSCFMNPKRCRSVVGADREPQHVQQNDGAELILLGVGHCLPPPSRCLHRPHQEVPGIPRV